MRNAWLPGVGRAWGLAWHACRAQLRASWQGVQCQGKCPCGYFFLLPQSVHPQGTGSPDSG